MTTRHIVEVVVVFVSVVFVAVVAVVVFILLSRLIARQKINATCGRWAKGRRGAEHHEIYHHFGCADNIVSPDAFDTLQMFR